MTMVMKTKATHYVSDRHLGMFLEEIAGKRYKIVGYDPEYSEEIYAPDDPKVQEYPWYRQDEENTAEFLADDYIDLECDSFRPALQYLADLGHIPMVHML